MAFSPADDQKALALEHIRYEIEQLADLWKQNPIEGAPQGLRNVWIGAIGIRSRVLWCFFETPVSKRYKDDILAEDFGYAAAQLGINPDLRERANKEIAHLTYSRAERPRAEWNWDLTALVPPLLRHSHAFVRYVIANWPTRATGEERACWKKLLGWLDSVNSQPRPTLVQGLNSTATMITYPTVLASPSPSGWRLDASSQDQDNQASDQ